MKRHGVYYHFISFSACSEHLCIEMRDSFEKLHMSVLSKWEIVVKEENDGRAEKRIIENSDKAVDVIHNISRNMDTNILIKDDKFEMYNSASSALLDLEEARKLRVAERVNRFMHSLKYFEKNLRVKMCLEMRLIDNALILKSNMKAKLDAIRGEDLSITANLKQIRQKYDDKTEGIAQLLIEKEELSMEREREEKERERKQKALFEEIKKSLSVYENHCESIGKLIERCADTKVFNLVLLECEEIKQLTKGTNKIFNKLQNSRVNMEDAKAASMIAERASQIYRKIEETFELSRLEGEAREAKQNETSSEANKLKIKEPIISVNGVKKDHVEIYVCAKSLEKYLDNKRSIEKIAQSFTPLFQPSMNDFRFKLMMKIITPLNTLTEACFVDKFNNLVNLLRGDFAPLSQLKDPQISELFVPYCTQLLAKKFADQAEDVSSSNHKDKFILASFVIALWTAIPEFGDAFLYEVMTRCPYIIPAYWPRLKQQSEKDYFLSLGYRYKNGKESQGMFLKRMNGIMQFYAAVLASEPCRHKSHPYGLENAWKWLAVILNLPPHADISATLIRTFLKIVGFKLCKHYGVQFQKLIHYLATEYYPRMVQVASLEYKGANERLKISLEEILKQGTIKNPSGILPSNLV